MFVPSTPDDLLSNLRCLQSARAKKLFRQSIFESWDHKCCFCGREATTLDHLRPKSLGGSSFRGNLAACCRRCNKAKATEDLWEWYGAQTFYCEQRAQTLKRWIDENGG